MVPAKMVSKKFAPWLLTIAAALGCSETSYQQEQGLYVSLVRKDSVQRFHNRLTSDDLHLVVTSEPVFSSAAASFVSTDEDNDLWIVELSPGTALELKNKLPGEVVRMGDFAVIRLLGGKDPHVVLGDHKIYAEKVRRMPQRYPAPSVAAGNQALLDDADRLITTRESEEEAESLTDGMEADQAFLREKLSEFSGAVPVTIGGRQQSISERRTTNGRTLARSWMRQQYEALGYSVSESSYGTMLNQGVNFVAEKAGADTSKFLIVSFHYDTVATAGADDNGTGAISALAIAQALADLPLKYNLRIVGFDQEELGLVGAGAYARSLNENGGMDGLIGVVNLEMTGYDNDRDGAFHAIHCNENTSSTLTAFIDQALARDSKGLKVVPACTNRSDHAVFWRYNKPAIVVSQNFFGGDSNPCYHAACDKVDRVNFDYMQRLTTVMIRAVGDIVL